MTSDVPAASAAAPRGQRLQGRFGDDVVLLTGFPSDRARALLGLLLEREPAISLWLVVPPDQLETAARSVPGHAGLADRVRLIPGEPCAIDLGLSRQTYAELASRVDRWFSLYQTTDPRISRELGLRVNLGAAREVTELSRVAGRLGHVTFLSSSTVFGDHQGAVNEEDLALGQNFRSAAGAALAVAEALLRRNLAEVPVSIVRTPQVLGARGGERIPRPTGLHRLLAVLASAPADVALPLPPGANRPVQAVPADFVAEALYAVSALGTRGHAYHFADPDPASLLDVLQRASAHFGRRFEQSGGARALGRLLLRSPGFWLSQQGARALSEWAEGPQLLTRAGDRLLERAALRAPSLLDYLSSVFAETEQLLEGGRIEEPAAQTPFGAVA
ncbi:MAG TPA: SDR family oxidoreductase [Polyangiaceae bacterium]|nr:SDR family oxidoreductase [Polyangiaceae bacterium]